jgi:hypothetical protein
MWVLDHDLGEVFPRIALRFETKKKSFQAGDCAGSIPGFIGREWQEVMMRLDEQGSLKSGDTAS